IVTLLSASDLTVPFEVPATRSTLRAPAVIVAVGKVQLFHRSDVMVPVASPFEPSAVEGFAVRLPLTVVPSTFLPSFSAFSSSALLTVPVHVSRTSLGSAALVSLAEVPAFRLKSIVVGTAHLLPQGLVVVEQRTPSPAAAVPTPTNAISAAAATTARPSIFR